MVISKKGCKRTIKYLANCKNPLIFRKIIATSPDKVITSICNAALNVAHGDIALKPKQKKIFSANRRFIEAVIRRGDTTKKKKALLIQKGGGVVALVIPAILSAVLSSLGSTLFE